MNQAARSALRSLVVLATTLPAMPAQDWWIEVGLDAATLDAAANDRRTSGFAPISLTVHESAQGDSFAVVWARDSTRTPWSISHGDSDSGFTTVAGQFAGTGYRPVSLDTAGDAPNRRFAAVWRRDRASFGASAILAELLPAHQAFSTTPYPTWDYSNFGYCLLGRVIEAVSGLDYESYMNRAVFGPACAARMRIGVSALEGQTARELPYVHPATDYDTSVLGDGATVPYVYGGYNLPTGHSLGGVVTSAEAYARVLVALEDAANSPLLSQSMINAMWTTDPNIDFTGAPYGFGWYSALTGDRFHGGDIAGSHADMQMRPDGVNFVVLIGRTAPDGLDLRSTIDMALDGIASWPSVDLFTDTGWLRTHGEGCGGPAGAPAFDLLPGEVPNVGESVSLVLDRLPPLATGATLFLGIQRIEFDLRLAGLAGCTLHTSPLVDLPIPAAGGSALFTLQLPSTPALVGADIQLQAFATDVTLPRLFVD